MEEIYYKPNLEDLTNLQLLTDYENLVIGENNLESHPEELENHHEILFNAARNAASRNDRVEPAESRALIYNYIQNFYRNKQPKAKRRLRGGRQGKKSKRRKSRKNKKSRRKYRR